MPKRTDLKSILIIGAGPISRPAAWALPVTVTSELLSTSNSRCTDTSLPTNAVTDTPAKTPPSSVPRRPSEPAMPSTMPVTVRLDFSTSACSCELSPVIRNRR